MKRADLTSQQTWLILGGAALMLSLSMGMRQSLGLLQPHVVRDLGITAADYSLALAIQNLVWGVTQPFVGWVVDRRGARPVAVAGVLIYAVGLVTMALASSAWMLTLGAGLFIGLALSCTASNLAMNVTARTVAPGARSVAMGAVSAAGSLGLVVASPLAQAMIAGGGWQLALVAFLGLVAVMLPAALAAGGADRVEREDPGGAPQSAAEALREAAAHGGYVTMALAFFVCGLQLVFLTTHLPTYLDLCGIPPSITAGTLAMIGLFNVLGSYLFGWLGGRYHKHWLLGGIYLLRSLIITAFFMAPPTPAGTLLFGAAMGALWLGVVPLVNGLVVHLFGLRYMATLTGIAFLSHQAGSFIGAWGGGLIYSTLGSYEWAWKGAVLIGVAAGLAQMVMNVRPSERIRREREGASSAIA
jgi:predicted MFS family arabinose efflux permease